MDVAVGDWTRTIAEEYLRGFVTEGGAAVKFAVAPAPTLRVAREEVARAAGAAGCRVVAVDGAATKLHLVEQLFFAVARQIEWDELAATVVRGLLLEKGFALPGDGEALDFRSVAEANDYDEGELRRDVRLLLTQQVLRDVRMAPEFRTAMTRLCQAQLDPSEAGQAEASAVRQWLRGELCSIAELKPALIFQRIARHNARDMMLSLAHWLRLAGAAGLVLVLDLTRYMPDRRSSGGAG